MDYEQILYDKMCRGCLFEKDCHDDAKNCDEYLEELEKYERNGNH